MKHRTKARDSASGPLELAVSPRFSTEDAERVALERFGIRASASPLPGSEDQNFLLQGEGAAGVLRFSRAGADRAVVESQHAALTRLATARIAYRFPYLRPALDGQAITLVPGPDGASHLARLLEYVPGVSLRFVNPRTPALLREVGRMLGSIDRALEGFAHPGADRAHVWDLRHGRDVVERHIADIRDPARRSLVERYLADFDARAAPLLPRLRVSVIHGDGNDDNVIVGAVRPGEDPFAARRVVGLVDFGDLACSYLVGEVAIAIAYVMLGRLDPVATAAHVVRGYHEVLPLTEVELEALYPLTCLRLCVSVALSAHHRGKFPHNEHLFLSEAMAWSLLERLAGESPDFAHYSFRDACDLPPYPRTSAVVSWLERNAEDLGSLLPPELQSAKSRALDLSVGSLEFGHVAHSDDAQAWTDAIRASLHAAGASFGIGRYDEPRPWYTSAAFRIDTDEGPEWRTIHLGVDLFVEPGTLVLAPLDGVVHSVHDNAIRLDYGPTVILRHEAGDSATPFFTLYGHLERTSINALRPGQRLRRGERIANVGNFPENGDWAPHLHFQIITDLLGNEHNFPGVARPSQRRVWLSLSPDPNLILRLPEPVRFRDDAGSGTEAMQLSHDRILELRREHLGESLSLMYRSPLVIVRGWKQNLYDDTGQPYLDCVNNVAHVGHSHPRVVHAIARQSAALNTNTRYLHPTIVRYAERLTALLPDPLRVCVFLNSGSEANELALRMARAHTRRRDVMVLDAAYHGNTTSLIEISPYKYDGPGGQGRPPHVHQVVLPDAYRGPYRGRDAEVGHRYAGHVRQTIHAARAAGREIAAFFVESLPSSAGQIVFPDGYLGEAFRHVRAAGGICVTDEVQVGLGRVGTHFWGFETQDVVPDIVTLGKPLGNGHPLGAVVTTPAIAAAFANGMEYFNTFGGNPVSCAAGLAVLDVIAEEGLQENALRVGESLLADLRLLQSRHSLIGDVRGCGLFIGIELVRDRDTLDPAGPEAAYLIERAREQGVLLSTDGPFHNVIKIKPPLVFSDADATRLVETLDRVLAEDVLTGPVQ